VHTRSGVKRLYPFLALLAGCSPPAGNTGHVDLDYTRTPVLFIHGSGLNHETWTPMIEYLERQGYPPAYLLAIDLVPNHGSNVRAAESFVAPSVERLVSEASAESEASGRPRALNKVAIVAHSMGAVSSRWFAAKIAPESVRTLITIAGANHGTSALRGHSGAGNLEMVPPFAASAEEGAIQVALNGTPENPIDETPYGMGRDRAGVSTVQPVNGREILYVTVRLSHDRWIKPASSALLDGAGGVVLDGHADIPVVETSPGNFLFQGASGHDELPRHPDVIRLVASVLRSRDRVQVGAP
jgi:pimeloyl-ACP methyl ester carboxylesterase